MMIRENSPIRAQVDEEARGAAFGSAALASFAFTVWALSPRLAPALVLALAVSAWTATCALLWRWNGPLE